MYRYVTADNSVITDGVVCIPAVVGNRDYDRLIADGAQIEAYVPPTIVPHVISDRQFFQMLAQLEIITVEEALAAVGPGTIPQALVSMIEALPSEDQFPARMLLTGATSFERNHPMVQVFGAAFGWTSEQIDEFWISASAL